MSNLFTADSRSFSSCNTGEEDELQLHQHQHQPQQQQQHQQLQNHYFHGFNLQSSTRTNSNGSSSSQQQEEEIKKKRNLPGTPDPNAEVIALSPTSLMAKNQFVCEVCNKGFQRDQNLQLHRRGHNLPWKLKQRISSEIKKRVYICPETTCVHHNPERALGDLTGIKKHFSRKHGEKKWKCDKCSKNYAVQSDLKAHSKICGTREYKCDCGTAFSRRDSFTTHRAFCDALTEENNKVNQGLMFTMGPSLQYDQVSDLMSSMPINTTTCNTSIGFSKSNHSSTDYPNSQLMNSLPHDLMPMPHKPLNNMTGGMFSSKAGTLFGGPRSISSASSSSFNGLQDNKISSQGMSATALLQKAAQMGVTASGNLNSPVMQKSFNSSMAGPPSSYGGVQQHNNSYDHISQTDHSQVAGMNGGGFINQCFLMKGPQAMSSSPFIDSNVGPAGSSSMIDTGMLMGGGDDQHHHEFVKNIEHKNLYNNGSTMSWGMASSSWLRVPGSTGRTPIGQSRLGGNGSRDTTMTVDFLGIEGSRSMQQQQQQRPQQQGLQGIYIPFNTFHMDKKQ